MNKSNKSMLYLKNINIFCLIKTVISNEGNEYLNNLPQVKKLMNENSAWKTMLLTAIPVIFPGERLQLGIIHLNVWVPNS